MIYFSYSPSMTCRIEAQSMTVWKCRLVAPSAIDVGLSYLKVSMLRARECNQTSDMATFFTIGHSTLSANEFVRILRCARVETVVDVRTVPRSRTNPQFNKDRLPEFNKDRLPATLAECGIDYVHLPELGGLRSPQTSPPASPNRFW